MMNRKPSWLSRLISAGLIVALVIGDPLSTMGVAAAFAAQNSTGQSTGQSTGVPRPWSPVVSVGDRKSPADTSNPRKRPLFGLARAVQPSGVFWLTEGSAPQARRADALFDGDGESTVQLDNGVPVRLDVRFSDQKWLDGVSLFGLTAGSLRVFDRQGRVLLDQELASTADAARSWTRLNFVDAVFAAELVVEWTPGEASMPAEFAFWERSPLTDLSAGAGDGASIHAGSLSGSAQFRALPQTAEAARTTLGEEGTATFEVNLPHPRELGQAYLVYDLAGVSHFTGAARSINGAPALGGERNLGPGPGGLQVEEIPVSALVEGRNVVEFLPPGLHFAQSYRVSNLRVVTLPRTESLVELQPLGDGENASAARMGAQFELDVQVEELAFHVKKRASEGKLQIRAGQQKVAEIELSDVPAGWHTTAIAAVLSRSQWLTSTFIGAGSPSIDRVQASGLALPRGDEQELVLSYPQAGECFDGSAMVRGFVKQKEGAHLSIQGRSVELHPDGSFEVDVEGLAKPWNMHMSVHDPSGGLQRDLAMQPCLPTAPNRDRFANMSPDVGAPYSKVIGAAGGTLEFGGARLDIPQGALEAATRISIRPVDSAQLGDMNPGMANLTPQARAFRLAPHGLQFQVPIKLELPVDESLVPSGGGKFAAGVFFYDEKSSSWAPVEVLQREDGRVVALTDHFTDFVSATIASPSSPGTSQFTPTSMSGLPPAHPLAGITPIAPPAPNGSGAATVQYALQVPPGRRGMQPELALRYSSSGGESWVGQGWDLDISSIQVDSRHGVPDYDGEWTQAITADNGYRAGKVIFQLDGSQLASVDGGGRVYERRISGRLQRIFRLDAEDGTGAYYFEVTEQDGTKYVYGRTAAARLADPSNPSHVGKWYLEQVVDRFGNGIEYQYESGMIPVGKNAEGAVCPAAGVLCASTLYPARIRYTTHGGEDAGYQVSFQRRDTPRTDIPVDARFGFLVADPDLLERVDVDYVGDGSVTPIRSYGLTYQEGYLGRSLLAYVTQLAAATGELFYYYRFRYNLPDYGYAAYSSVIEWTDLGSHSTSDYAPSARSEKSNRGGGGVTIFGAEVFGGSGWGGSSDTSSAFVDMRGDRTPDFVIGSQFYPTDWRYSDFSDGQSSYRGGYAEPSGGPVSYTALGKKLGENKRNGWEFHGHFPTFGFKGLELSGTVGETYDKQTQALADMNGDGLVDVVEANDSEMKVYLNLGEDGLAAPIDWGGSLFDGGIPVDPIDEEAYRQARENSFPVDPILAWRAPFSGVVFVDGAAQRQWEGGNTVSVSIYHEDEELWNRVFGPQEMDACGPDGVFSACGDGIVVGVEAGDWLYFRATASGLARDSAVLWSPRVRYSTSSTGEIRPYGLPAEEYEATRDFRVAGAPQMDWTAIGHADVRVSLVVEKESTPDELEIRLFKIDPSDPMSPRRTEVTGLGWTLSDDATSSPLLLSTELAVSEAEVLEVVIESDFMVDPNSVSVDANISYLTLHRVDPTNPSAPIDKKPVSCTGTGSDCTVAGEPIPGELIFQSVKPRFIVPAFVSEPVGSDSPPVTFSSDWWLVDASVNKPMETRPSVVGCHVGGQLLEKATVSGQSGSVSPLLYSTEGVPVGEPVQCALVLTAHTQFGLGDPQASFRPAAGINGTSIGARTLTRSQAFRDHSGAEDNQFGRTEEVARAQLSSLVGGFHRWFYGEWNGLVDFDPSRLKAQEAFLDLANAGEFVEPEDQPVTALPLEEETSDGSRWGLRGGAFIEAGRLNPGRSFGVFASGSSRVDAIRKTKVYNVKIDQGVPGGNAGLASASSMMRQELVDMNGDGLPDIVTAGGVRYNLGCQNNVTLEDLRADPSLCQGGFTSNNSAQAETPPNSETRIATYSAGGGGSAKVLDVVNASRKGGKSGPSVAINASFTAGVNYGQTSMYDSMEDINGDGLRDYLKWDVDNPGTIKVRLNLGYRLSPEIEWDIDTSVSGSESLSWRWDNFLTGAIHGIIETVPSGLGDHTDVNPGSPNFSDVTSSSVSGGGGVSIGGAAWGGGIGASHGKIYSMSRLMTAFVDVTGDGRVDHLQKFPRGALSVRRNMGHRFAPPEFWSVPEGWDGALNSVSASDLPLMGYANDEREMDVLGYTRSRHSQTTVSGSICFFFACVKASYNHTEGKSHRELEMRDINGDGFADFVLKLEGQSKAYAKMNQLAGSDLLVKIEPSVGAAISIEYDGRGHTPSDPGDRYVLEKVTVHSDGDTGPDYTTTYEYGRDGNFDRDERSFMGFASVVATRPDGTTVETLFENEDYYASGLPLRIRLEDAQGKPWAQTAYEYEPHDDLTPLVGTHRPHEIKRTSFYYEGMAVATLVTAEHRTWDSTHGNLTRLFREGDRGIGDDVAFEVEYAEHGVSRDGPPDELFAVLPERTTATGTAAGVEHRRREATYDENTGATLTVTDYVTQGPAIPGAPRVPATTSVVSRDIYGNPTEVTNPIGYSVRYQYDEVLNTYVARSEDSFGYYSTGTTDYRYGLPEVVGDINGNQTRYAYDQFGRLSSIYGPNDSGDHIAALPTVDYEYVWGQRYPLAVTRYKDVSRNDGTGLPQEHDWIETAVFVDDLGRTIQTKKDHVHDNGTELRTGTIVSGGIAFDVMGRVSEVGQPRFVESGQSIEQYATTIPFNSTTLSYDVLGRVTEVTTPYDHPDSGSATATTSYEYGFAQDSATGEMRFRRTVTDPLGNKSWTSRDLRGLVVETVEQNALGDSPTVYDLPTSYRYNPMGELVYVSDPGGNITLANYDSLGRMVSLESPDAGLTTWQYDLVGNPTEKVTARLRSLGQRVTYNYQLGRLQSVNYPDGANRSYVYGGPSERGPANGNLAGRIKQEFSEAGENLLTYDRMGNVSTSTMTYPRQREPHLGDYTARVEYEHDSFGRLLKTRFPATEVPVGAGTHTLNSGDEVISYNYDAGGNLQSVFGQNRRFDSGHLDVAPHTDYVMHIGYDEFGQRSRFIAGNFSETKYAYEEGTRRLSNVVTTYQPPGQPERELRNTSYRYDKAGNITRVVNQPTLLYTDQDVEPSRTQHDFTYDKLYQLRTAVGDSFARVNNHYAYEFEQQYDELGNITYKNQDSRRVEVTPTSQFVYTTPISGQNYVAQYFYDGSQPHTPNRIVEDWPNESANFERNLNYDASGNQLSSTFRNSTRAITWTADDMVREIQVDGQTRNHTLYDAHGERAIRRHPGSGYEETAYLGGSLTIEGGRDVTKHIYVGSERVASKMDPTWFNNPPVVYLSSDHLGTAQYTTNNKQALVQHDEYLPTGEPWFNEANSNYSLVTKHLYAGKEYDGATKLYDYGARHYDPRQGQWISPDPILASYMGGAPAGGVYWPANLNAYGFVANNPIKYVDQDGEFVIAAAVVAGILIGGGIETYRQYSAARQASQDGAVSLGSLDWGRIGFAAGIGGVGGLATGGLSAALPSTLGMQLLGGLGSGAAVGMGTSTSMQLYDGRSWSQLDRQAIVQAGALGAAGGFVGAAGGFALNHALRSNFSAASNADPMVRVFVENVARFNKTTLGKIVGEGAQSGSTTAGDLAGAALGAAYSEGAAGLGNNEGGAAVPGPQADQGNAVVPTRAPSETQPVQKGGGRGINPEFRPYLRDAR